MTISEMRVKVLDYLLNDMESMLEFGEAAVREEIETATDDVIIDYYNNYFVEEGY